MFWLAFMSRPAWAFLGDHADHFRERARSTPTQQISAETGSERSNDDSHDQREGGGQGQTLDCRHPAHDDLPQGQTEASKSGTNCNRIPWRSARTGMTFVVKHGLSD